MWYCPSCGIQNDNKARFCTECGLPRPAADPASGAAAPAPRRKSYWWVWTLVALAVLAVGAAIFVFTYHDWIPATCTEPAVCRICGREGAPALGHSASPASCTEPSVCTRCGRELAPALGHDWQSATCTDPETCSRCGLENGSPLGHDAPPATCTEPSVCARCGQTVSPALGHNWQPATYDAPETCSRCGRQQGNRKGWVGSLSGEMDSATISLTGTDSSHAYLLNDPVNRCFRITLHMKVTAYTGDPFGSWGLYGRDLNGRWQRLDTFYLSTDAYNEYASFSFTLSSHPSFDALALAPLTQGNSTVDYSFYYSDVQEYVD